MKPGFALSLSVEGIVLLHRSAGGWRGVGEVALDTADIGGSLAALRDRAATLEPDGILTKLIIPNDQIRYLTIDGGDLTSQEQDERVRAALDGATPYSVDDLAYDAAPEGAKIHIAAVARETLAEAEAFAADHGFNPVSFVAIPGDMPYLGEPFFGPSAQAAQLLPPGQSVEPDGIAVVVIGQVDAEAPATPDPSDDAPAFATRRAAEPEVGLDETPRDADPADDIQSDDTPVFQARARPSPLTAAPRETPPPPQPDPVVAEITPAPEITESLRAQPEPDDPAPPEVTATAEITAPARAQTAAATDEAARMTVFGARQTSQRGKPRHLGLILTAILLVFLVGVAAWAALFLDDEIAAIFGGPDDSELVDTGEAALPPAPVIVTPDPGAPVLALREPLPPAQEPAENAIEPVTRPAPPAQELSDTDTAVLDALQRVPLTDGPAPDPELASVSALAPVQPVTPAVVPIDTMYVPSIDGASSARDAVALPEPGSNPDVALASVSSPAAPGTQFQLDARGLVIPQPDGAVTPDGIVVYLGRPAVVPPPTPARLEQPDETEEVQNRLSELRPRLRPTDLVERNERGRLGGRTVEELAGLRPRLRPEAPQIAPEVDETPTAQAVAASMTPRLRPANFSQRVARQQENQRQQNAETQPTRVAAVAPRTVTPRIPSSASVARQATLDNAINLSRVNLIGVYGTPSNRRALVRLPSGRYKKVKVGDAIDGGRVRAIGDSELRYTKGSRSHILKIPSG